MLNNISSMSNISLVSEDNWNITPCGADVWYGKLPFKTGDSFPTSSIEERAMISKTNHLIYNNNIDDIYSNIISVFPELDPMYGWQIREIVTNLPYFNNATKSWVGLVAGSTPLVDASDDYADALSEIVDNSNFASIIQEEVASRFTDVISAYRVDVDPNGNPVIIKIEPKNLICFVNKDIPNFIEVTVVFSIYSLDGYDYIDFVEYHYDGLIRKHTFYYSGNTIGAPVRDPIEEMAFGGSFKSSPVVVFKHNAQGNSVYGTDQYRYWYPSMLAGMRELQNILRLGERTRELIRKVPESSINKNPVDGSSTFFNRGTIAYKDGLDHSPDIEYVVPEIRMDEAVRALDHAIKQIAIDTQLGISFFNPEALGSNLSADSIRATMYPARLEAQRIVTEMKPSVKELILKLGFLGNLDLKLSDISVEFYDGFPKDELNDIKTVQLRLESSTPSITLEDAIMKLDRVPLRIARQKASEIRGLDGLDGSPGLDVLLRGSSTLTPSSGDSTSNTCDIPINFVDNNLWENQMPIPPRNIRSPGMKGAFKSWIASQAKSKDSYTK